MKLAAGGVGWALAYGGAALGFVACGGNFDSFGDKPKANGGGAGASHAGKAGEEGDDGGTSPLAPDAEGGRGGEAGSGGEGGGREISEETFPLSREEVARIAGTSFATKEALTGACDSAGGAPPAALDALQLAFVANDEQGVDVIVSTLGPWLNVLRSRLLRTRAGYVVSAPAPTAGCMVYDFEDTYQLAWRTPKHLALDFSGNDDQGKVTSLSVEASFVSWAGARTLTAIGRRDTWAPRVVEREPWIYDQTDRSYYSEERPPWSLPRRFIFSEALRPGWTVALENDAGDHFEVARSNGIELATGFDVVQFFPPGFHWVVTGSDFAGNALQSAPTYRSDLPALEAGSFEAGDAWPECNSSNFLDEACVAAAAPGHAAALALAGNRSLFVGEGSVTLRIARASNASKLLFRARLLGYDDHNDPALGSYIQALDAGSSASESQRLTEWSLDPELSTAASHVTLPQDVSLKLPPGQGDVLLHLATNSDLWLDSVRTE